MVDSALHTKKIGLVLSSVPGYSETFFRNKITGLQALGYEMVLIIDYWSDDVKNFPCEVVVAPDFSGSVFRQTLTSLWLIIKSIVLHPVQSYRHYNLDKAEGLSFKNRMKRLIQNQFLLSLKLDWLHFGFGMLAVGREQVADAIGAQMAVSFRGFDLYLSPLKHPNCYDSLFKKHIKYHVLAEEMVQTLIDYGIKRSSVVKITPAIDINLFSYAEKRQMESPVQLITVARLHWKKGLEYTLEALAILKQAGISFKYTIIGEGSEYERLVFAAHQLDVLDRIDFKGKMPQKDVKAHLEQADVYLQYSIQEGFCNAVLEAQAMGLLCVVSNAEGLSENVIHDKTGWVVAKRRPQDLATKIMEIVELSDTQQDSIRKTAVNRVREDFNIEQQIQSFVEFYKIE